MTYSFARVHLPSLVALGFSALLHIAVIWSLSLQSKPMPAKLNHSQRSGLQVHLLSAHENSSALTHINQEAQSLYAEAMQPRLEALANLPQMLASNSRDNTEPLQTNNDAPLNQYYSSKDTDRKALPVGNIDTAMLQGEMIDNFPLQFRIYIDDKGKVKSIEQLAVLEQDKALANKLERLLYDLTFIPAKKNGVEVNSYQDIEFSFQASINEAHAPVGAYSIGGGLSK
ncbi:MAG TPA: hypothetical protein VGJ90_03255 [Methylophilaceae bacterium]|jgi:hypothetical protein